MNFSNIFFYKIDVKFINFIKIKKKNEKILKN